MNFNRINIQPNINPPSYIAVTDLANPPSYHNALKEISREVINSVNKISEKIETIINTPEYESLSSEINRFNHTSRGVITFQNNLIQRIEERRKKKEERRKKKEERRKKKEERRKKKEERRKKKEERRKKNSD